MAAWREFGAVAVGGVVGTGLRLSLDVLIPHSDTAFPLSTLVANVAGAFALGALVSTLWIRPGTPNWLKVGLGAGTLGSFTTFSALMASVLSEANNGLWMLAVLYLVLSLVLGFGAAALGFRIGHRPATSGSPTAEDLVDE